MSTVRRCPALFITAPASGQDKTTVTDALARYHRSHGQHVQVFKTDPTSLTDGVKQIHTIVQHWEAHA